MVRSSKTKDSKTKNQSKGLDTLLRDLLKKTRVVEDSVSVAVLAAARDFWPDLDEDRVRLVNFRRGVLHIVLDSHARYAEARGLVGDRFRQALNRRISPPEDNEHSGRVDASKTAAEQDGNYVTKVVFHVEGTY